MRRALALVDGYRRSSGRVKVHQYTRVGLYFFGVMEAALMATWALRGLNMVPAERVLVLVVGAVHIWLTMWLTRDGLRYYLGTGPRPDRLYSATLAVTLGGVTMALLMVAAGRIPDEASLVLAWFPMFFASPGLLVPRQLRRGAAAIAVPTAVALLSAMALDLSPEVRAGTMWMTLVSVVFFAATARASAWTLKIVDELDVAREAQSRLAVAEERLRFGRDMHDVLGRNLSVIALKSELAAQLSQRGSAAAVDQMTEVQRIARESQQEMRAVLRGYREADLLAELSGARGVLEAAGITCSVSAAPVAELPPETQVPLGWVVREGTTNVLRHSDAKHCAVRLELDDSGAGVLSMTNDGVPQEHEPQRRGTGLHGLRERLAEVNGTLTAEAAPGGRFVLTARVPRPAAADRSGGGAAESGAGAGAESEAEAEAEAGAEAGAGGAGGFAAEGARAEAPMLSDVAAGAAAAPSVEKERAGRESGNDGAE